MAVDFSALEAVIRQDPKGRGVASFRHDGRGLAAGMLEGAASELASHAGAVGIVTGFCIADFDPPTAETDGPPGALYLARALSELGVDVVLITDRYAMPLLQLGCRLSRLNAEVFEIPLGHQEEAWLDEFFGSSIGKRLTHLVSIERVGPSHTPDSLAAQRRDGPAPLQRFLAEVPPEHRDVCHNMRGLAIDDFTAPAHRLFEAVQRGDRRVKTVGIGDGGNEIGMGAIPWELLRASLEGDQAGRIICRVAVDFPILAGVSNWGAYALACGVASLRGQRDLLTAWNERRERDLIEALVREAGAIDGLTRRREATVDGLDLEVYLDVLARIRAAAARTNAQA
ncbi:MAG TPA: glutamate cyclase domain-containing protein [Pirellulales bacterium]|nr:glutamate cyclase domain-containing protein [Pirellulales bacterium]